MDVCERYTGVFTVYFFSQTVTNELIDKFLLI